MPSTMPTRGGHDDRRLTALAVAAALSVCIIELDRLEAGIAAAHCDMALHALRARFDLD